jgi:hypothetical protein
MEKMQLNCFLQEDIDVIQAYEEGSVDLASVDRASGPQ